jgi:hypothetical protein
VARPARFELTTSAFGGQSLANTHLPEINEFQTSTNLNSRKNKDKSERSVLRVTRLPGMYETGPRYTLSAHTVREVFLSQKSIQPPNNSDSDAARAFGVALDPR